MTEGEERATAVNPNLPPSGKRQPPTPSGEGLAGRAICGLSPSRDCGAYPTPSSAFCRRRWTELPMPSASRYLATVRRAMSKPLALSRSTSVSSDRIALAPSAAISAVIAALHRLGRHRVAAVRRLDRAGEEIFELEQPARAAEIFVRVTRLTVDSCIPIASATCAQRQRPQMRDAVEEERLLLLHDLGRDLDDRALALVERLDQPVGAGEHSDSQAFDALSCGPRRQLDIIAAVDQQARQGRGVDLDRPAGLRAARRRGRASPPASRSPPKRQPGLGS